MVKKHVKEFKKQTNLAIIAALSFLIAFAWRDFISDTLEKIVFTLGVSEKLYIYKLFSAIIITILAIIGIAVLSKTQTKEEK